LGSKDPKSRPKSASRSGLWVGLGRFIPAEPQKKRKFADSKNQFAVQLDTNRSLLLGEEKKYSGKKFEGKIWGKVLAKKIWEKTFERRNLRNKI